MKNQNYKLRKDTLWKSTYDLAQQMYAIAQKILTIDTMIADIDNRIAHAEKTRQEQALKDLEPWLEKYKLWQKMQD